MGSVQNRRARSKAPGPMRLTPMPAAWQLRPWPSGVAVARQFKFESGDWTNYRNLPEIEIVDFHRSEPGRYHYHDYGESMWQVYNDTIRALRQAQKKGKQYALFIHGSSTSRPGKTRSRSQVRKAMQSKEANPFIIRSKCIKHDNVFVAAIRPTGFKLTRALRDLMNVGLECRPVGWRWGVFSSGIFSRNCRGSA
jgi:hypothetical protein